jgi:hypothetical protein
VGEEEGGVGGVAHEPGGEGVRTAGTMLMPRWAVVGCSQ